MSEILTVIPARYGATRLPGKPLREIAGLPLIVHVYERAREADLGPVLVATDDQRIADVISDVGGEYCMTRSDHQSGTDRVFEAVSKTDPDGRYNNIVNLQGDLPTLDPQLVGVCAQPLEDPETHIATLGVEIDNEEDKSNPNIVKVIGTPTNRDDVLRTLYFTRATAPHGEGPLYHHIGIYAFRRQSLERFVSLRPTPLELREKLEQLRALENGMRIDCTLVDTIPLGVDTPADLDKAAQYFKEQTSQ